MAAACAPRSLGLRSALRSSAARSDALGRADGLERESRVDRRDQAPRQAAPLGRERGRAGLDRARDLLDRHAPERVAVGEDLPEEDADRPDVALGRRVAAFEPLGSDVRERSRNVSDRGQRVGPVELREAEVEEADGDRVAVLDEDVRRLHVAVDDPGPVRMGERVEHLGGDLDGILVGQLAGADRLAQRASGDVLVGDVDVARVVADVVGTDAAIVAEPPRGEGLALGTSGRFALARDDLERDVEPVPLVEGEPDRARPTRAERAAWVGSGRGRGPGLMGRQRRRTPVDLLSHRCADSSSRARHGSPPAGSLLCLV